MAWGRKFRAKKFIPAVVFVDTQRTAVRAMTSIRGAVSGVRFEQAIARIDSAHAEDPNKERADGQELPSELLYAQRMSAMLDRFAPDASEALRLALRCQHLCRWKIPRSDYPMTSGGYQQWRSRLMNDHAELASEILRAAGYDDALIGRVQSLVRKERLKTDPEAQTLEDVTVLVFLENSLAQFVRDHSQYDEAKLTNILRRIARKMSQRGREAALTLIRPPPELMPRIRGAIDPPPSQPPPADGGAVPAGKAGRCDPGAGDSAG